MVRFTRILPLFAVAAVVLHADPAGAHTGSSLGGLGDGVLHPILGLDHLLAMLAVGVVAALVADGWRMWAVPGAFLGAMLVGGSLALAGLELPGAEPLILASVVALGAAIVVAVELRERAFAALLVLLAVAGAAHGQAHGAEAPSAAHPLAYVAGFVAATAAIHLVGMGAGALVRQRRPLQLAGGMAVIGSVALLV